MALLWEENKNDMQRNAAIYCTRTTTVPDGTRFLSRMAVLPYMHAYSVYAPLQAVLAAVASASMARMATPVDMAVNARQTVLNELRDGTQFVSRPGPKLIERGRN